VSFVLYKKGERRTRRIQIPEETNASAYLALAREREEKKGGRFARS